MGHREARHKDHFLNGPELVIEPATTIVGYVSLCKSEGWFGAQISILLVFTQTELPGGQRSQVNFG